LRSPTRAEVRELDRLAIEEYGLPGIVLMENAGGNVARLLHALGVTGPVAIACGRGNNGGDGFAAPGAGEITGALHVLDIGAPAAVLACFGLTPASSRHG